jgi:branched-chain amino acid transport system permease protein
MGNLIIQLLVNGMITGSFYALFGLSWGIIYKTTRIFHFSHHLVFTIAGYAAVLVTSNAGLHYSFGFVAAIISAVLAGCSIEVFLYRKLRSLRATQATTFLASMGLAVMGVTIILLILSSTPRSLKGFPLAILTIGPANCTNVDVLAVISSWVTIGLLLLFLLKSKFGKAIRAVSSNKEMAETVGLDIGKIYLLVFGIGSGLFGIASFLFAAKNVVYPYMGMQPFFIAFTAVFLGGVKRIEGAALAGLLLGLAENIWMIVLPGEYKLMIAYAMLVVVIIFKPEGLLSRKRSA